MLPVTSFKNLSFLMLIVAVLAGCQKKEAPAAPFEGCKYGVPAAIFQADLPGVTSHAFDLNSHESIETMAYHDGRVLNLIQSGCDSRKQEFSIQLANQSLPTSDSSLLQLVQNELFVLSKLDLNLGPAFQGWITALEDKKDEFVRQQPLELQPGYFARVDRIKKGDDLFLRLIFSDQP